MSNQPIFTRPHCEQDKGNSLSPFGKIHVVLNNIFERKYNENINLRKLESDYLALGQINSSSFKNDVPKLMQSYFLSNNASTSLDSFTKSNIEMYPLGLPIMAFKLKVHKERTIRRVYGKHLKSYNENQLIQNVRTYSEEEKYYFSHRAETYHSDTSLFSNERIIEHFSLARITTISLTIHRRSDNSSDSHIFEGPQ